MRAFVFCRRYAIHNRDLADRIQQIEEKYDEKFQDVHDAISYLLERHQDKHTITDRNMIGYKL